jgi:glutathione S-transferase
MAQRLYPTELVQRTHVERWMDWQAAAQPPCDAAAFRLLPDGAGKARYETLRRGEIDRRVDHLEGALGNGAHHRRVGAHPRGYLPRHLRPS